MAGCQSVKCKALLQGSRFHFCQCSCHLGKSLEPSRSGCSYWSTLPCWRHSQRACMCSSQSVLALKLFSRLTEKCWGWRSDVKGFASAGGPELRQLVWWRLKCLVRWSSASWEALRRCSCRCRARWQRSKTFHSQILKCVVRYLHGLSYIWGPDRHSTSQVQSGPVWPCLSLEPAASHWFPNVCTF